MSDLSIVENGLGANWAHLTGFNSDASGSRHLFWHFVCIFLRRAVNHNSINESGKSALVELLFLMHYVL